MLEEKKGSPAAFRAALHGTLSVCVHPRAPRSQATCLGHRNAVTAGQEPAGRKPRAPPGQPGCRRSVPGPPPGREAVHGSDLGCTCRPGDSVAPPGGCVWNRLRRTFPLAPTASPVSLSHLPCSELFLRPCVCPQCGFLMLRTWFSAATR